MSGWSTRRALVALTAATVAATAGCSGTPDPPSTPSQAPATSAVQTPAASPGAESSTAGPGANGAPTTPATPATPTTPATPASDCLTGKYRLARFVGAGSNTYGTGQGGDITVAFDHGEYVMTGPGKEPITVTLAGQSAPLTVDGTIEGVYSGTGDEGDFTRGRVTGSATATANGKKQTFPMAQVANVLGLSGNGKLSCTADQLTITLKAVRLELER